MCLEFIPKKVYLKNLSVSEIHVFYYKKIFYKNVSLENPKSLRKCLENLQPEKSVLQFLKPLIFARELFKSYKIG